jgi:hypothetical protein
MTPIAEPTGEQLPPARARTALASAGGVAAALLAALLAVRAPHAVLLAVLLPVQLLLAAGWLILAATPARGGGLAVAGGAALTADLLLVCRHAPGAGSLAGAVGLGVVAAVVGQLFRRERSRVTDVLAAHCAAVLLAVSVAPPLALLVLRRGELTVATGMLALALTLAGSEVGAALVPAHRLLARTGAGLVVGIGGGTALGGVLVGAGGVAAAAAVSGATVVAELVAMVVAGDRGTSRPLAAALPFALAAPGLYVVGRVMLG